MFFTFRFVLFGIIVSSGYHKLVLIHSCMVLIPQLKSLNKANH
jgi:hypothetical protein